MERQHSKQAAHPVGGKLRRGGRGWRRASDNAVPGRVVVVNGACGGGREEEERDKERVGGERVSCTVALEESEVPSMLINEEHRHAVCEADGTGDADRGGSNGDVVERTGSLTGCSVERDCISASR